jgi:hypothetical protein
LKPLFLLVDSLDAESSAFSRPAGQPFIPSPRNPKEESQMSNPWKTKEPFQVVLFDGIDLDDWKFLESMGLIIV